MRKAINWVLALVLLAAAVQAAAVQINTIEQAGQLSIVYPKTQCLEQMTAAFVAFDVLDSNLSRLTGTGTDCLFSVTDHQGNAIAGAAATYNTSLGYWYYELSAVNTQAADIYNYYVYCNSSSGENGFVSDSFEVNPLGDCQSEDNSPIAILILIPLIFGLMLIFGGMLLDPEEHSVLRIFMMLGALMSYFASSFVGVQALIRYTQATEMQDSIAILIWVFGVLIFVIIAYFFIYAFYKAVQRAAQKRKEMMGI